MKSLRVPWSIAFVFLISILLISSGCTSIPGPEPRSAPAIMTTLTPNVVVTMNKMRVITPQAPTVSPTLKTTTVPLKGTTVTPSPDPATNQSLTCAQQNGVIALPGQQCPGTWLIALDTFSCCSTVPVREVIRNTSVIIEPFNLVIVMDDDPGNILP